MKILSIVGARPNFMKIAPFINEINKHNKEQPSNLIEHVLVHTGQHYDDRMSKVFFKSLNITEPHINLGIGSGTHAEQVGNTMISFEKILKAERPDWVVVLGDVNATLACSVTAKKEHIKVCHIEAGLRSGDMSMPEEINRIVTDSISDLLLTPDKMSSENLENEGKSKDKVCFVGNIMIDTLEANRVNASKLNIKEIILNNLIDTSIVVPKTTDNFSVATIHRPSNVDKKEKLKGIVDFFQNDLCKDDLLLWTLHPRTKKQLQSFGLFKDLAKNKKIILLTPLNYHEMLKLNMESNIMLTDSGGIQEECCVLGTTCITLRQNTERPITLFKNGGVSVLVGSDIDLMRKEYSNAMDRKLKPKRPDLWDGHTAKRCLDAILNHKGKQERL